MATVFLPNTFIAGTPAVATEVNQNFIAITDQVNGNLNADNLVDSAVTAIKLAPDSVTTSKIGDFQVSNDKLAAGISVTKLADGSVSDTEFQYLSGVTSAVQTQLNTILSALETVVVAGQFSPAGNWQSTGPTSGVTGWSIDKLGVGEFEVTYPVGLWESSGPKTIATTAGFGPMFSQVNSRNTSARWFLIKTYDTTGTLADPSGYIGFVAVGVAP